MLIEIEGTDGTGKTTLAKKLADALGGIYQKFPDRRTVTGAILDDALRGRHAISPVEFQALQTVNRLEKLPRLKEAKGSDTVHLVADRYQMSGLVYGMTDGVPRDWLMRVVCDATPVADLHVLLLCDPIKIEMERLAGRDRECYEMEGVRAYARRQELFSGLWEVSAVAEGAARWRVFRTDDTPTEEIATALLSTIKKFCEVTHG